MNTPKRKKSPHRKQTRFYSNKDGLKPSNHDVHFGYATIVHCPESRCWLLPDGVKQGDRRVYALYEAQRFAKQMHEMMAKSASPRLRTIPFANGVVDE